MSEPRTATGQALTLALIRLERTHDLEGIRVDRDIVAIEAEARAALLAELRAKVDALPHLGWRPGGMDGHPNGRYLNLRAVLALLDDPS